MRGKWDKELCHCVRQCPITVMGLFGREILFLVSAFQRGDVVGLIRQGEASNTCGYGRFLVDAALAYRISYHHVPQLVSTPLHVSS